MRKFLNPIILLLIFVACNENKDLSFDIKVLENNRCESCPQVRIHIPEAIQKNKISDAINASLREEIIANLTFDEQVDAVNIEGAIASFIAGYRIMQKMHPEEMAVWEARIDGVVTYEDRHMLTIKMVTYLYTGGAHGYGTTRFLNFNKKAGNQLADWELFVNKKEFERFAENKFRVQEDIPRNTSINSTGYMFDSDSFYLPENIGFTREGVKLLYNQYEVASYAEGPIELLLPFKEVEKYLSVKTKS